MLHTARVALAVLAVATLAHARTFETPVPLGGDLRTLRVAPTEVFAPGARIDVVELDGRVRSRVPGDAWYRGGLADDPDSTAVVAVGPAGTRGFVAAREGAWAIGRDGVGVAVPPAGDGAGCGGAEPLPPDDAPVARALSPAARAFPPSILLVVDLAVETNYELWASFGTDEAVIDFIGALVAEANVAFERDLRLHVRVSYLRLWATPADPWTGVDSLTELQELRAYWRDPANAMDAVAGPRDVVHLVSGRRFSESIAGRAYLDTVCNTNSGYGFTRTAGRTNPADVVQTFVHELGHAFGSPHSHCYTPPLDRCFGGEDGPGCYDGPNVPSVGTVMSYCHSYGKGLTLAFHPASVALIRARLADAACLAPICDAVESHPGACDDGDPCTDDGCDPEAGCTHVPVPGCCRDAADCADGNACTDDVCNAAGRCEHAPTADGAPCGTDLCRPQSCAAGACVDAPGPEGYQGLSCDFAEIDAVLLQGRADMQPGARTRLRAAWKAAFAPFRAATRARARGRGVAELRAMNRLAKRLARLDALLARFERRSAVKPALAAAVRAALGDARRSTAGIQASLAP